MLSKIHAVAQSFLRRKCLPYLPYQCWVSSRKIYQHWGSAQQRMHFNGGHQPRCCTLEDNKGVHRTSCFHSCRAEVQQRMVLKNKKRHPCSLSWVTVELKNFTSAGALLDKKRILKRVVIRGLHPVYQNGIQRHQFRGTMVLRIYQRESKPRL